MTDIARFAAANGIELCYETFGDADDETLLLISGLGLQLNSWPVDVCTPLAQRGFQVVRFDNRDVGLSTKIESASGAFLPTFEAARRGEPVGVPYCLADLADDAVGLLDALGVEAAHVVGASMGGAVAQLMAINHPDRVRSLTSIMSTTGERGVGDAAPEALRRLLRSPGRTREEVIAASVETRRFFGGGERFDERHVRAEIAAAYDRCWYPAGVARQLLAAVSAPNRAEGLRSIGVPTLVVHGDRDPLIAVSGGRRTAELVSGARLLIVDGMGHHLDPGFMPGIVAALEELIGPPGNVAG